MKKVLSIFAAALLGFASLAYAGPTATLTWVAPTSYSDGTPIPSTVTLTYNIYQGTSATTLGKVATGVTAIPDAISTGLSDGQTYYFAVTAVAAGLEGAQSNV